MSDNRTFVSYSRSDSEFALRLAKDLRALGAVVWLDQLDIAAGTRWDSAIEEALRGSTRVLVLLSPKAVASQNVLDEMSFALEEGKAVVPVLVEACMIPLRLRRLQYVDFTLGYEPAMTRLLGTLGVAQAAAPKTEAHEPRSPVVNEPPIFTPPPAPASQPVVKATFVGIAAAVLVVAGIAFWLSSRGHQETQAPADTTASTAPADTPSGTPAAPVASTPTMAAQQRLTETAPRVDAQIPTAAPAGMQALLSLTRSFAGRDSLTDDELRRLGQAQTDACAGDFSPACVAKASEAVTSLTGGICARRAGPPPKESDKAESIKHDLALLSCRQEMMKVVLDQMDELSRGAIRKIKPG